MSDAIATEVPAKITLSPRECNSVYSAIRSALGWLGSYRQALQLDPTDPAVQPMMQAGLVIRLPDIYDRGPNRFYTTDKLFNSATEAEQKAITMENPQSRCRNLYSLMRDVSENASYRASNVCLALATQESDQPIFTNELAVAVTVARQAAALTRQLENAYNGTRHANIATAAIPSRDTIIRKVAARIYHQYFEEQERFIPRASDEDMALFLAACATTTEYNGINLDTIEAEIAAIRALVDTVNVQPDTDYDDEDEDREDEDE